MLKEKWYLHPRLHYNKHRRINRLIIKINEDNNKNKISKEEYIVVAKDITVPFSISYQTFLNK